MPRFEVDVVASALAAFREQLLPSGTILPGHTASPNAPRRGPTPFKAPLLRRFLTDKSARGRAVRCS
jgi:hypothetical protein